MLTPATYPAFRARVAMEEAKNYARDARYAAEGGFETTAKRIRATAERYVIEAELWEHAPDCAWCRAETERAFAKRVGP
jgi:hypothetical protein